MENPVRKTTLEVMEKAKDVKINRGKIREIAEKWAREKVKVPAWPKGFHLKTNDPAKALDYLILLDAINFCFWSKKGEKWNIEYKKKKYDGYFALSLALKKFFEENSGKGSLDYFSKISFKEFTEILQGGKNLQFLKKRWQIARTVSRTIAKKYGTSESFVKSANQRLSVLTQKIYKELPSFNDTAYFKNRKIYFLKRAQILGCDIMGFFRNKGLGHFKDPEYLTAFADYKVPQILHCYKILGYSDKLRQKIENRTLIPNGSLMEIEIRSATIWAVEYLRRELAQQGMKLYSFEVDWILWNQAQKEEMKAPYHLTKTIFY